MILKILQDELKSGGRTANSVLVVLHGIMGDLDSSIYVSFIFILKGNVPLHSRFTKQKPLSLVVALSKLILEKNSGMLK